MTKLARTDTFEHTISGLIRKRADLFAEAETIRDRLGEIRNDIEAVDRALRVMGYAGDLDVLMPRSKRQAIFGPGELSGALMRELRDADGPLTSRELAESVVSMRGDPRDRRYVAEITRRVCKALRVHRDAGRVRSSKDSHGNLVWSRRIGRTGEIVNPDASQGED